MSTVIDRLRKSRESRQTGRGEKTNSSHSRKLLWIFGISALALVLVLPLSLAFAVHGDGLFELGDG